MPPLCKGRATSYQTGKALVLDGDVSHRTTVGGVSCLRQWGFAPRPAPINRARRSRRRGAAQSMKARTREGSSRPWGYSRLTGTAGGSQSSSRRASSPAASGSAHLIGQETPATHALAACVERHVHLIGGKAALHRHARARRPARSAIHARRPARCGGSPRARAGRPDAPAGHDGQGNRGSRTAPGWCADGTATSPESGNAPMRSARSMPSSRRSSIRSARVSSTRISGCSAKVSDHRRHVQPPNITGAVITSRPDGRTRAR